MTTKASTALLLIVVLAFAVMPTRPQAKGWARGAQADVYKGDTKAAFDDLALQLRLGLLLAMPDSSAERFVGTRGLTLRGRWPNESAPVRSRWAKSDTAGYVSLDLEILSSTAQRSGILGFVPAAERPMPDPILSHLLNKAVTRIEKADEIELRFGDELALNSTTCTARMIMRIRVTTGSLIDQELTAVCKQ